MLVLQFFLFRTNLIISTCACERTNLLESIEKGGITLEHTFFPSFLGGNNFKLQFFPHFFGNNFKLQYLRTLHTKIKFLRLKIFP